ncbi:MAG TPA: ABC transporter substrate-binding protein [Methylomirabilota bacterium]|nr:ABC transporter substrate-binding protein [Methylomirabilota bacterium]
MTPSRFLAIVLAASLPSVGTPAGAGEPSLLLQRQLDRVVAALDDRQRDPAERRRAVRAVVEETFDFEEAARRALGHHWNDRTPADRARFVGLFVDLIDRAYLRRVEHWNGGSIAVVDDTVEGERATVRTAITGRDGGRTPVDFRMRRAAEGRWRVVDVSVGGTGLLASYRVQFARLMDNGGFPHLLERLEAKVASLQP